MAEMTLCPHFLVDYPYSDPSEIESNILRELEILFEKIDESQNLNLVISKHILDLHYDKHPWNLYEDPIWRPILNLWVTALYPAINKAEFRNHDLDSKFDDQDGCDHVSSEVKKIFNQFLNIFGQKNIARTKNEEAVYHQSSCNYQIEYKNFILVDSSFANSDQLHYPWLRIYPPTCKLPTTGDYPFVPPSNWQNSLTPIKNNHRPYGYIDSKDRVWGWDRLHKDHWDVQLDKNGARNEYDNVSPDGVLLDNE